MEKITDASENKTNTQTYSYLIVKQQWEEILVRKTDTRSGIVYHWLQNQKRVEWFPSMSEIKQFGELTQDQGEIQQIIETDRKLAEIPQDIKDIAYISQTIAKFHNLIKLYNTHEQAQIQEAYNIMLNAHKNQLRDEWTPYIYHPITIATWIMQDWWTYADVIIGLLHDAIEDNEAISHKDLEKVFGSEIADAVSLLSKNGLSDEEYKNNIQKNNKILTIKAYDRRHNIASLLLQPDQQKKDRYIQKTETELLPIFKNKIPKQAVKIENILSYIKTHNNMPDIIQERIAANKKIISLQGEL